MYVFLLHTRMMHLNHEVLDYTVKITVFEALWSPPLPIFHLFDLFICNILWFVYIYTYEYKYTVFEAL
jgi:hypothetical protein